MGEAEFGNFNRNWFHGKKKPRRISKRELDRLLEKAVADALGVSLSPVSQKPAQ